MKYKNLDLDMQHLSPMLYYFCVLVCLTVSEIVTIVYFHYPIKFFIIAIQTVVIIEYFALFKKRLEYFLGVDYISEAWHKLTKRVMEAKE